MFILTQNRTGVVDTSKCLSIRIVEDAKTIRAYGLNSDTWFRLGYYQTTKRAKDVIQEINTALCENRISFDMPED